MSEPRCSVFGCENSAATGNLLCEYHLTGRGELALQARVEKHKKEILAKMKESAPIYSATDRMLAACENIGFMNAVSGLLIVERDYITGAKFLLVYSTALKIKGECIAEEPFKMVHQANELVNWGMNSGRQDTLPAWVKFTE